MSYIRLQIVRVIARYNVVCCLSASAIADETTLVRHGRVGRPPEVRFDLAVRVHELANDLLSDLCSRLA